MPTAQTIHELFDQVADTHPDRTALVAGDGAISYGDLRLRADALASMLRAERVETIVGVYLPRSFDLVVALLAVLKAGCAYLPLSPEYPHERLRHVIGDAGAARIVTSKELARQARRYGPAVTVLDDTVDGGRAPGARVPQESLAYLIYTSGSAGSPKGVGVSHRNLLGLVQGQDYVRFAADETFLQLAPSSYDASAFEIWGALLNGARLVVASSSYAAIDELPEVLRQHRVTTLLLPPALFHELVRHRADALSTVRRLIVGGEAMAGPAARAYAADARSRGATLANVYGPTETTTLVSCHDVRDLVGDSQIPIGRPIRNAALHLLDPELRPVGAGTIGEIYIGGRCVTRGYHGQPGLTASRFVPDPFSNMPGARMYASGDLGRLRPDGEIEFVGRNDDQVKVRGHRVELGEIEHALLRHPQVHAAAVTVSDGRLVAHLVADELRRDHTSLGDHLATLLPSHLLPSVYLFGDALPRTPTGKVDRTALPAPAPLTGSGGTSAVTVAERDMADIWQRVLGVAEVGPDDDFFALGGDSLLAIRVIIEAEGRGVELTLTELFEHPTVRGLSSVPAARPAPEPAAPLLPESDLCALPDRVERVYPVTRMQLGLIYETMWAGDESLYHDVVSTRVIADLDEDALRRALDLVGARHCALRTSFDLGTFSVPVQLVDRAPGIPLTMTDDGFGEASRPFDLACGPLLRVCVTPLDRDGFQLTVGFQHAIMDGWSESVFTTELLTAYSALLSGSIPDLGEPEADYESFVRLEQQAVESEAAQGFWRERCASLPTLPEDRRRGRERIKLVEVLPAAVRGALERTSASWRLPVKTLLTAAHLVAVARITGSAEAVTGLVVNGRPEAAGADRLIGMFLNVIPTSLRTGGSWRESAQAIHDAETAAAPYRRYPYPQMRQALGCQPLSVAFNYVRFHLMAALQALPNVRVDAPVFSDRTSYPLFVEVTREPTGGPLTLEISADPLVWNRESVVEAIRVHRRAIEGLARDETI